MYLPAIIMGYHSAFLAIEIHTCSVYQVIYLSAWVSIGHTCINIFRVIYVIIDFQVYESRFATGEYLISINK